jgi:SAM-dependent methyltransferase
MNQSLLQILACPACKGNLQLTSLENGDDVESHTPIDMAGQEVISGLLRCECGNLYPVIEGVARFLDGGIKNFPLFMEQHRRQLECLYNSKHHTIRLEATESCDDYENIRRSFSQEWKLFNYDSDKTWGWTLEERKRVFLEDVKLKPEEGDGKYLLDAGCGNGALSAALCDLGLRVVGIDLNDGLELAYRNRTRFSTRAKEQVDYVQGNLLQLPFREGVFDLVYSSGVIHHTPDSRRTFERLVSHTRKGGRLYVWVYGKRAFPVRIFFRLGRNLKYWISLKSLAKVCRVLAPFYKVAADTLNGLHLVTFRKRTIREITLDLFDAFAPRFNHYHTEKEVLIWFKESGFKNISVSGHQKHGFGVYGDRT